MRSCREDNRNDNVLPVVSMPSAIPSFQTPFVILDNPPRQAPVSFQPADHVTSQTPAAIAASGFEPVSSAPIPALQPALGPAPAQMPPYSSTTVAAAAPVVSDRIGTAAAAEVSWSVVEGASGGNGWSPSSTSGYMQMTGRQPSASAAVFSRAPTPAVRHSLMADMTSPDRHFGGGVRGGTRGQYEDQEQSASMSGTGTVHFR